MKNKFFFILKLIVALALVYLVVSRIEVDKLLETIKKTDIPILLVGVFVSLSNSLFSALRWQAGLQVVHNKDIEFVTILKLIWASLFLGQFTPGYIGSDIYKAITFKDEPGGNLGNISIILIEKIVTLYVILVLMVVAFPFCVGLIKNISFQSYLLTIAPFLIGLLGLVTMFLYVIFVKRIFSGTNWLNQFMVRLNYLVGHYVLKDDAFRLSDFFRFFRSKKYLFSLFGYTLLTAIGFTCVRALILLSFDVSLPFQVHLFVSGLMSILFMLPVSLGGVGIREAGYVILYGLFGVTSEEALVLGVIGTAIMLLHMMVGATSWLSLRREFGMRETSIPCNGDY